MKVYIIDYADNKVAVEVPDDTQEISGVIISGDMVMESPSTC